MENLSKKKKTVKLFLISEKTQTYGLAFPAKEYYPLRAHCFNGGGILNLPKQSSGNSAQVKKTTLVQFHKNKNPYAKNVWILNCISRIKCRCAKCNITALRDLPSLFLRPVWLSYPQNVHSLCLCDRYVRPRLRPSRTIPPKPKPRRPLNRKTSPPRG